jgi:hypothetical protein
MELEFFLRLTVSQPVRLDIGPPLGTLDQILSCSSFSSDNYFILRSKAPSLTRKRICSLECNHSLVRSLTPNHNLPPHLRLCSLFVASYDSQGLRWKYSNPPPHGVRCYGDPKPHNFIAQLSGEEASPPDSLPGGECRADEGRTVHVEVENVKDGLTLRLAQHELDKHGRTGYIILERIARNIRQQEAAKQCAK